MKKFLIRFIGLNGLVDLVFYALHSLWAERTVTEIDNNFLKYAKPVVKQWISFYTMKDNTQSPIIFKNNMQSTILEGLECGDSCEGLEWDDDFKDKIKSIIGKVDKTSKKTKNTK